MIEWVGPLLRRWLVESEAALDQLLPHVPAPPGEWGPLAVHVYDESNTGWLALREAPPGLTDQDAVVAIFQLEDYDVPVFGKQQDAGAHHAFVLPVAVAIMVTESSARRGRGQVARIQRAALDSLASLFSPAQAAARRDGALALDTPQVSVLAQPGAVQHAILAGLIRLDIPIVAAASVLRPA